MFNDLNKTINNNTGNKPAGALKGDNVMPISPAGDKQAPGQRPVEDIFANTDQPAPSQPDKPSFAKATDDKPSFAKATDDKPSFAKATDDKPSFAKATDDKPTIFQPKTKESVAAPVLNSESKKSTHAVSIGDIKKYLILGAMAVGLFLIGLAGYWAYNNFFKIAPVNQEETGSKIDEPVSDGAKDAQQPAETPEKQEKKEVKQIPIKPKDSDQDGLTDEEEKELGTDINNVDTDDDGLFDREEVQVYKTDPLNADSDNDGYLDGEEVKAGYNPMGPGMLYKID
ncbi:MAG: hypothetical protein U9R14_02005 [Patescibacteria group bacterium]|nr:hypothetical protein [Patescibacteria group bacterium]